MMISYDIGYTKVDYIYDQGNPSIKVAVSDYEFGETHGQEQDVYYGMNRYGVTYEYKPFVVCENGFISLLDEFGNGNTILSGAGTELFSRYEQGAQYTTDEAGYLKKLKTVGGTVYEFFYKDKEELRKMPELEAQYIKGAEAVFRMIYEEQDWDAYWNVAYPYFRDGNITHFKERSSGPHKITSIKLVDRERSMYSEYVVNEIKKLGYDVKEIILYDFEITHKNGDVYTEEIRVAINEDTYYYYFY